MSMTEKLERFSLAAGVLILMGAMNTWIYRVPTIVDLRREIRGGLALVALSVIVRCRY